MARTEPEWLQGPGSGPSADERKVPTFDLMVETLRDLCGREVHLSAPHVGMSTSHLASRGELAEESTDHDGVLFTAGGGRLFLREEDFQDGERHMAEYGHYFWVTIRTATATFRLQDTDS